MKIKVILSEPYKGMISGAPTRYIGIMKELNKNHELYIFAPGNTELLRQIFPDAMVCKSTEDKPQKKHFTVFKYFLSIIFPEKSNILFPMFNFFQDFSELVNNQQSSFDLIFYFGLGAYVFYNNKNLNNSPQICDLCDSMLRHLTATSKNCHDFKSKFINTTDIFYIKRIKKKFVNKSVKLIVTTNKDAIFIRKSLKSNSVYVLPNGIYVPKIKLNNDYLSRKWSSKEIIFCGSLNYLPNINSIIHILNNIWLSLHSKLPGLKFSIVGRDPDTTLLQYIKSFNNVNIYSNVPDVFTYYQKAKLLLSPMFLGGGIKNKILEALCTATPIITNKEGAIGVDIVSGIHGTICETNSELIDAIFNMITISLADYKVYANKCFELAQKYSWTEIGKQLEDHL